MTPHRTRFAAALIVAIGLFACAQAAPSAGAQATLAYWRSSFETLEAFVPNYVCTADGTRLWQSGFLGQVLLVRCWPAGSAPMLVIAAGFPPDVPPPDDGMTWAILPRQPWTPLGLPDRDAYCIRARALWMAQVLRAAEFAAHRRVRAVLLAEGLDAPAALAVAAMYPSRVVGVVLVNPRPWRHFIGSRVALGGREGRVLAQLLARHPRWRPALADALRPFDIAELGPYVRCPVAVLTSLRRPAAWMVSAADKWGWLLVHSARRSPPLAELCRRGLFSVLWADVLARLEIPVPQGLLARAAP